MIKPALPLFQIFFNSQLKSVHFNTQLHDPHFFQNCGTFQYNISWLCFDVSWCCIEKYHNFERNEDCATVFLKWMDFRSEISSIIFFSSNSHSRLGRVIDTNLKLMFCGQKEFRIIYTMTGNAKFCSKKEADTSFHMQFANKDIF